MIHDAKVEVTCDGPKCYESIEIDLPFTYPDFSGNNGRYDHRPRAVDPLIKAREVGRHRRRQAPVRRLPTQGEDTMSQHGTTALEDLEHTDGPAAGDRVRFIFTSRLRHAREHIARLVPEIARLDRLVEDQERQLRQRGIASGNAGKPSDWYAGVAVVNDWLDHLEATSEGETDDELTTADVTALVGVEAVLRLMIDEATMEAAPGSVALAGELVAMLTQPLEPDDFG